MSPYEIRAIKAVIVLMFAAWGVYVALRAMQNRSDNDLEEFKFRRRIRRDADRQAELESELYR